MYNVKKKMTTHKTIKRKSESGGSNKNGLWIYQSSQTQNSRRSIQIHEKNDN